MNPLQDGCTVLFTTVKVCSFADVIIVESSIYWVNGFASSTIEAPIHTPFHASPLPKPREWAGDRQGRERVMCPRDLVLEYNQHGIQILSSQPVQRDSRASICPWLWISNTLCHHIWQQKLGGVPGTEPSYFTAELVN